VGCLQLIVAALAGLFLFLTVGFAITSWWGALLVALGLLVLVGRRIWREPRLGVHARR
jgi:hypothetical protein